jgi:hypothetical protein
MCGTSPSHLKPHAPSPHPHPESCVVLACHRAVRLAISDSVDVNALKGPISNFYYESKSQSSAMLLGVSSYGTAVTQAQKYKMNQMLAQADANLSTTFVIGDLIDRERKGGTVITTLSSVKGAMDQYEQYIMGYDKGLFSMDFTFKISAEGIPWATIGSTDIQQSYHFGAFGPCSPTTNEEVEIVCQHFVNFIDFIVDGIHHRSLPADLWRPALVEEIYRVYSGVIDPNNLKYRPVTFISDMADELPNGAGLAMPSLRTFKNDWAHVVGATSASSGILNQAKRLLMNGSEERVKEVHLDFCFIHDVPVEGWKKHQVRTNGCVHPNLHLHSHPHLHPHPHPHPL